MTVNSTESEAGFRVGNLVLGVDTCGPTGSVALARIEGEIGTILAQTELAGRSYSATLVAAVAELLERHHASLRDLRAIVVVNGPGSFTGVRVGLSAVKGLAEPAGIPVVAVSRLEVMAGKAGVPSAALGAHRHEVFLRLNQANSAAKDMLAGAVELAEVNPSGAQIAVCDEDAAQLLQTAWPNAELLRTSAPMAADAIEFSMRRVFAGEFDDLELLDGHYLRRSDAEIFGDPATAPARRA
jgi:tRNA threonylcarbamoyladenosine biosynthesis protein TsaB